MIRHGHAVTTMDVAARSVAGVRVQVPFGRVAEYFGAALDQVYAAGRAGSINLDGQNIFIYHPAGNGMLTADFCVGTAAPFEAIDEVVWRQTPSGIAATTTHWGDYSGLRRAHDALQAWCREQGLTCSGPSWEVYGHWDADPAKLRTDIYYLVDTHP